MSISGGQGAAFVSLPQGLTITDIPMDRKLPSSPRTLAGKGAVLAGPQAGVCMAGAGPWAGSR